MDSAPKVLKESNSTSRSMVTLEAPTTWMGEIKEDISHFLLHTNPFSTGRIGRIVYRKKSQIKCSWIFFHTNWFGKCWWHIVEGSWRTCSPICLADPFKMPIS
jgi:hypothetical protein